MTRQEQRERAEAPYLARTSRRGGTDESVASALQDAVSAPADGDRICHSREIRLVLPHLWQRLSSDSAPRMTGRRGPWRAGLVEKGLLGRGKGKPQRLPEVPCTRLASRPSPRTGSLALRTNRFGLTQGYLSRHQQSPRHCPPEDLDNADKERRPMDRTMSGRVLGGVNPTCWKSVSKHTMQRRESSEIRSPGALQPSCGSNARLHAAGAGWD